MRRAGEYRSHAPREAVTSAWKRTSSSLPPGPMAMALGNQVAPRIRRRLPTRSPKPSTLARAQPFVDDSR